MKTTVLRPTEITITHIGITLPVRYEEEDIPNDFPLRKGDIWEAMVNIDTGEIEGWPIYPRFQHCRLHMKVCDSGTYTLFTDQANNGVSLYFYTQLATIDEDYVPHGVVPGEYGDYVDLQIDNGVITNWPKNPNVSQFFRNCV